MSQIRNRCYMVVLTVLFLFGLGTERGEAHRVVICSADVQLVETYRSMGVKAITKPAPIGELQQAVQVSFRVRKSRDQMLMASRMVHAAVFLSK